MSQKSYIHKKRIVYTALSPFFKGESLMQVMVIWDKKYSHTPSTSVQHFVNEIKENVDVGADTRAAHLSLIRTNSLQENDLLADPSVEIEEYVRSKNISESAEFYLPQFSALQAFIVAWQRQLDMNQNQLISSFINEHIHQTKIDPMLAMSFTRWLNNSNQVIRLSNASNADLRKITSLFYSASCEYLGPVKSDHILNVVVAEVNRLDGGRYQSIIEQFL